ncbi:MAG: hypothetical protein A2Y14_04880 [Verrucomicrobia bacterium GWF2_51_19]|nr:MAG: hypothetical protein A2Y14_04880 [Verrucomicrobia bacterium GWF2_51_19]
MAENPPAPAPLPLPTTTLSTPPTATVEPNKASEAYLLREGKELEKESENVPAMGGKEGAAPPVAKKDKKDPRHSFLMREVPDLEKLVKDYPFYKEAEWAQQFEKIRLLWKVRENEAAEKILVQLFNMPLPDEIRKILLLELVDYYEKQKQPSKAAVVYEKFIDAYQHDPLIPELFLRVGRIYRDTGAFSLAISRFYNVINLALKIDEKSIPLYRQLTIEAQIEIAETYFIQEEYKSAARFLEKIHIHNLPNALKKRVLFRLGYSYFKMKDFPKMVPVLKQFIETFPTSYLVAESHFLLANAYKELGRKKEAVDEVMDILRSASAETDPERAAVWRYWQKRTSNQIANNFYEQGDFINALRIYQTLAKVDNSPDWQWPILYQIGLCFERLRELTRAKSTYLAIVEAKEWKNFAKGPALTNIQNMARWRLDNLIWVDRTEDELQKILNPDAALPPIGQPNRLIPKERP